VPDAIEKMDLKWRSLVTAAILGQAARFTWNHC